MTLLQLISAIRWCNDNNIHVDVIACQTEDQEVWIVQAWFEGIESSQVVIYNIKAFVDLMNTMDGSNDNIHAELKFQGDW